MGEGRGFGKVILFNEHFVVYGIPSIVSAIAQTTTAKVEPFGGRGIHLEDLRSATPRYKEEKIDQQRESVDRILKAAGMDPYRSPIKITLKGDLVAASGIGASAASCVAIARAVSDEFGLHLSDVRINEIAFEGERAYHGTPSGVDNTAATCGGLIWFVRNKPNVIERIEAKEPIEIVMGNTGKIADTVAVVDGVRERREKHAEKYGKIFRDAEELAYNARKALENFDLKKVGKLMDDNHKLLQTIEVSCKELDFLVELARDHGAFGAKLTGGGCGGSMVALTPGKDLQEKVAKAIGREGFEALRTKVGVKA
jgi:mevalonate kinase